MTTTERLPAARRAGAADRDGVTAAHVGGCDVARPAVMTGTARAPGTSPQHPPGVSRRDGATPHDRRSPSGHELAALQPIGAGTVAAMLRLRQLLQCVRPARGTGEVGALVRHELTSTYLGPGLVLTDRSRAVTFESVAVAEAFLARHGNEPCLVAVPVAVSGDVVGTAA